MFLFYVFKNFEKSKLFFGYSIICTFIILIIDGFVQFIFGKNIFLFELQKYNSELSFVTSFFDDEKKLGSFLSRMFPLLLISLILIKDNYKKIHFNTLASSLIILTFILVFLTTETFTIFIILIFTILIFLKSKIFLKPKISFFLLISFSLFVLFYFYPSLLGKIKSILYSTGILFPGYTEEGKVIGEYEIGKFIYSKFHHDQIIGSIKIFLIIQYLELVQKILKIH